jgi:hypothetical protein
MIDRPLRYKTETRWFPNRASADRWVLMKIEFSLNQPNQNKRSMSETVWATGDIRLALAELPPIVPLNVRRQIERLLQPWPQGRYTPAYHRSGGILNLFTPQWGEAQDEVWHKMLAEWHAQTFPDDQARRAARAELEQRWNNTPHPFFAGLTPAQVMVGGGEQEAKLADEFLNHLEEFFDETAFDSEGDMLIKTLMFLRSWQLQPLSNGQTPQQIILAERTELLNRRARILAERA